MLGHGRRRHSAKAEKPLSKTEDKIRCAREDALNASECEEYLTEGKTVRFILYLQEGKPKYEIKVDR